MKTYALLPPKRVAAVIVAGILFSNADAAASGTAEAHRAQRSGITERIYLLKEVSVAPKLIKRVRPVYPKALKQSGVTGDAIEKFVVTRDGRVTNIETISATHPAFGAAAEKMLSMWRFSPGLLNGAPVDVAMTIPVSFEISSRAE